MRDWHVPGCAVGVVKGQRTIYASSFGLRDVKRRLPVTESTKFYTASFGKAFTATLAAMLVEEGKLEWDRPVQDYLPSFRMYDPVATERATLRDFLAQRTGLGRHGGLWVNSPLIRSDILQRLRYLEPCKEFRSAFEYSNVNYIVAGALMEHVTGRTWEDLVRSRILEPLGMKASRFVTDDLSGEADIATGYEWDGRRVLPFFRSFRKDWDLARINGPCAPAGAILSDVGDMCRYLRLHMHGGKVGRRRIVGERNLKETHTPHVFWPGLGNGRELLEAFYTMGWLVQPYRGYRCVRTGGNAYGFGVHVAFFPGESFGVVVLTNQVHTLMAKIVARNLCDRLLGLDPIPWNRRYLRLSERQRCSSRRRAIGRDRKRRTAPARASQDYVGEYEHPAYGRLAVTCHGGRLRLEHNGFPFSMKYDHDEVFTISLPTGYAQSASFKRNEAGKIISVAIPFAPGVGDIVFTRLGR